MFRQILYLFAVVIVSFHPVHEMTAQEKNNFIAFEFQAYPTGLIPGLRFEKNVGSQSAWHFRLGYNWIRHRDLGKHDDERGDGLGFTIGHQRYFKQTHTGWHLGLRSDIWWNTIDWKDRLAGGDEAGTTEITVIQPTLSLGYAKLFGDALVFTPTVSIGWEWNVRTSGEPTGEGAILLIGFHIGKQL